MRTLIFQYYIGDLPDWAQLGVERFKKYAESVGADYLFSNSSDFCENPYFEHLRLVYDDQFLKYDKILYADVDVIVENFEENIFDISIKDIGLVPEYKAEGMNATPLFMTDNYIKLWKNITQNLQFNVPLLKPKTIDAQYLMFNSGIILWSREGLIKAKKDFDSWRKWNFLLKGNSHMCLDQPYLNGQVAKYLDYTEMPLKWNCFPRFRFFSGKEPKEMNFVHYTGSKKQFIMELYK